MRCLLSIVILGLAGCNVLPKRHIAVSPTVTVSESGKIDMAGDAQTPPKVETKKTDSSMALPEGSRLEFNEKLGVFSVTLSKPSSLVFNRTETAIEGPVAFTPDKAPTIGEEKEAQASFWTSIGLKAGLALGGALAIFGLVRAWDFVMYGGAAIAAGCAFGIFIERHHVLLLIIGLGATLTVVGPIIWHTKLKKLAPTPQVD